MSFNVDTDFLKELAGEASTLAGQVGGLADMLPDGDVATLGNATLAAAVSDFTTSWQTRAHEMQDELGDAGEFLVTFAESAAALDEMLSGEQRA